MSYDRLQIACLLIDAYLTFRAGAILENRMNVFDGAAASEIVEDVIHELKQLMRKLAHGDFCFFAEINQFAFDTVASGAPFVFFNQGARVKTVALIALLKAV